MKKFNLMVTAVSIAAVLFSCGNNASENAVTKDTSAVKNATETVKAMDTAIIQDGQSVFFDNNLKDGDVVKSPLVVHFGVKGMKVLPIDSGVVANCGHHHLLVDTLDFVAAGNMVPMGSSKILHFGKGQTQSKPLELKPGQHTLTLQFANGTHTSYGMRMSKTIHITVK
jgi:citrate lyase alpha subunit